MLADFDKEINIGKMLRNSCDNLELKKPLTYQSKDTFLKLIQQGKFEKCGTATIMGVAIMLVNQAAKTELTVKSISDTLKISVRNLTEMANRIELAAVVETISKV